MSNNSTPGPWAVKSAFRDISVIGPYNKPISTLSKAMGEPEEDGVCRSHSHNGMMANAHLIAAAPDLLEALEAMLDVADNGDHPDYHLAEQSRKALGKAKGETP